MADDPQTEQAQLEGSQELYVAINGALSGRVERDKNQARWYELVKYGWRRRSKPYQGCSDADIKMADSMIERVKPSYYAAIRGGDSLYRFTGLDTDSVDAQDDAAYLFDDRLNYHSNFNKFTPTYIHSTLQCGVGMSKTIWDAQKHENDFCVIPPEFWLVPQETDDVQDADWFVHIIQISVDSFLRDGRYSEECRTKEYADRIKGGGNQNAQTRQQAKCRREGLTYSEDANTIILWEIWERTPEGAWGFSTKAPILWGGESEEDEAQLPPEERATVRPWMLSPYKHGKLPFVPMKFEQPEEGIYAPRGIPELVCSYQTGAVKALNEQQDRLTFVGRPCFAAEKEVPGASNITLTPGLVLPFPVKVLDMGSVPLDYEKHINLMRELAEWRIQTPDFGVTDEHGGARTAREMSLRAQESQQGANIRIVLMREALEEIGEIAWSNICQFDSLALDYIRDNELKQADPKVFSGKYRIQPGGAVDGSSKLTQIQQAEANVELGSKFPFVNLPELVGDFYGLQGPSLRKRYIMDGGQKEQAEMERQATELTDMIVTNFPVKRKPYDDDISHLNALNLWGQACQQKNTPPAPEVAMLVMQHGEEHAAALNGNTSPQAKQVLQGAAMLVQYLSGIIQQQPSNVLPMGAAGAPPTQPSAQAPNGPSAASDPKTGASVVQSLASAVKAGIPVSLDDINAAFKMAGLPPLDGSSPIIHDPGSAQKPQGQPVGGAQ